MNGRGPVSQPLLEEVRGLVAKHAMVVWLDKAGHYTDLLDGIDDPARAFGGRLVSYRGSYLELLAVLAEVTKWPDKQPLVVHVPGANRDTIKQSPLFQLYAASFPFERALDTLVRNAAAGRVPADEVDDFLHGGAITLVEADAWLAARSALAGDSLTAELRAKQPGPLIAELLDHRRPANDPHGPTFRHALAARFGLPDAWPTDEPHRTTALGEIAAEWVMAVEYVHDLRRSPKADVLKAAVAVRGALLEACREAAQHLRVYRPQDYKALARNFEDRLGPERTSGTPEELGKVDTFSFEEDRLMQDAIDAVQERDWARARRWADERIDGGSVWLRLDPSRLKAWRLLRRCAVLGQAIRDSDAAAQLHFDRMHSLDEATAAYAEHGAEIDRHHRELEQAAATDLLDRLPHETRIEQTLATVREVWRTWAEERARAWSELTLQGGALPEPSRQQRTIFEDVVAPMLREGDKTAYFVVDALRFEMAQELVDIIGRAPGFKVHLQARLCELPAVTEVGMNVLAPLARRGRLEPKLDRTRTKIEAWRDGTTPVSTPGDREKAINARIRDGRCRWVSLEEVIASVDAAGLKEKIRRYPLVVVHSRQIDNAGEHGSGLSEFSRELRRIEKARQLLQAVGVRRFVITADHGFVLRDANEQTLTFGRKHDSKGRYALYGQPVINADTYSLRLAALDYEGGGDDVLVFPRGLGVFEAARGRDFVHGGNSPQERVIPVLTIENERAQSVADEHYRIVFDEQIAGTREHRIVARVERADNQVSLTLAAQSIPLELRVADVPGVRVDLTDAEGANLEGGMITVQTGRSFSVSFRLLGPREQRVPVKLIAAIADVRVDEAVSRARFDVAVLRSKRPTGEIARIAGGPAEPASAEMPSAPDAWLDAYDDPDVRKVMAHIASHGEATENDVQMLVGSARAARRFARKFEEYRARAPFVLNIVTTASGKAYRKVTDT